MRYRKLTLNLNTLGLINDRLNKIISNGIIKIEGASGNQNPAKKSTQFGHPSFHRNRVVEFHKKDFFAGPRLVVSCEGIEGSGASFDFGDIFYLGNDVIFVKSAKPDPISEKIRLRKITLLSRTDAPHAMHEYKKHLGSMINMACYFNGWDRMDVPEDEVNRHIDFLDKNRGKNIYNPTYETKKDIFKFESNFPDYSESDFEPEDRDDIDEYLNTEVFDD